MTATEAKRPATSRSEPSGGPDNPIRVAVVSPVHNRRETTHQFLKSLVRARSEGLDVVTIIVDDGSTDGTSEAVRRSYPDTILVEGDGELWYSGGVNLGIRTALDLDPRYVLVANNDSVFDEDFLLRLVECAESNPRSVVGPLLLLWDRPHRVFQTSPKWETFSGGFRHWRHQTVWTVPSSAWEVEIIVGNCVLIPAEAIRRCGVMDQKRYPHYGDAEYTPRLRKNGFRLLIEPKARVFCQPNDPPKRVRRMSAGELWRTLFADTRNQHNFRHRFRSNIDGAPNPVLGVLAFISFFVRALTGTSAESSYREKAGEKPLSEVFADKVVGKTG